MDEFVIIICYNSVLSTAIGKIVLIGSSSVNLDPQDKSTTQNP